MGRQLDNANEELRDLRMAIGQADSYNETLVRENDALRKEIEELINSRRKGKGRYRDDDESEGEGRQIKRHRTTTVAHSSEEEDDEDVDDEARVSLLNFN